MPDEVIAVTQTYNLILWAIPQMNKLPREHKFSLGERITSHLYDLLELLIAASYSRKKSELLLQANQKVNTLRYMLRLAKDLKIFSIKRYEHGSKKLVEVGKQIGGWQRSLNRSRTASV